MPVEKAAEWIIKGISLKRDEVYVSKFSMILVVKIA